MVFQQNALCRVRALGDVDAVTAAGFPRFGDALHIAPNAVAEQQLPAFHGVGYGADHKQRLAHSITSFVSHGFFHLSHSMRGPSGGAQQKGPPLLGSPFHSSGSVFQQAHGRSGHALSAAGEAQALFRGGLHAHLGEGHPAGFSQVFPHLRDEGSQLGPLGNEGGVDVADGEPLLPQQGADPLQQHQAVRPLIGRVRVREQLADVPQGRGPQQGVGNGVGQHVRVGVAQQPFLKGHLHPAQDELAPLHQLMHVVAASHTHGFFPLPKIGPGGLAVLRGGELDVSIVPGGEAHLPSRRLDELAVVRIREARGLGPSGGVKVHLPLEGLGGLDGHEPLPRGRGLHKAFPVGQLAGVLAGHRRRGGPIGDGVPADGAGQLRGDEGPGPIMDEQVIALWGKGADAV